MAENRIAEVAKLFSKKLGEKFRLEVKTEFPSNHVARFTKDGIEAISIWGDWRKRNSLLVYLLTGKAEIVGKWGSNDD